MFVLHIADAPADIKLPLRQAAKNSVIQFILFIHVPAQNRLAENSLQLVQMLFQTCHHLIPASAFSIRSIPLLPNRCANAESKIGLLILRTVLPRPVMPASKSSILQQVLNVPRRHRTQSQKAAYRRP